MRIFDNTQMDRTYIPVYVVIGVMFIIVFIVLICFYFGDMPVLPVERFSIRVHTTFLERISRTMNKNLLDVPIYRIDEDYLSVLAMIPQELDYALLLDKHVSLATVSYWSQPLSEYITQAPRGWKVLHLTGPFSEREGFRYLRVDPSYGRAWLINLTYREIFPELIRDFRGYQITPPLLIAQSEQIDLSETSILYQQLRTIVWYRDKVLFEQMSHPQEHVLRALHDPRIVKSTEARATKLDIIVSYFDQDLEWLNDLLQRFPRKVFRVFLYNKGSQPPTLRDEFIDYHIKLNNLGRCDNTYVYHCWSRYHAENSRNLLFFKDSSHRYLDNDSSFDIINNYQGPEPYGWRMIWQAGYVLDFVKNSYYSFFDQANTDHFIVAPQSLRPMRVWYEKTLEYSANIVDLQQGIHGATFICPSTIIDHLSERQWSRLLLTLAYGSNIETGHYMETAWGAILLKSLKK